MTTPNERSAARLAAAQALYQMEVAGKGLNDILAEFEALWIGPRGRGRAIQARRTGFFRDISPACCRTSGDRPADRRDARRRLAAEARRSRDARDPARGDLRTA